MDRFLHRNNIDQELHLLYHFYLSKPKKQQILDSKHGRYFPKLRVTHLEIGKVVPEPKTASPADV
jgi:hypothetical protein